MTDAPRSDALFERARRTLPGGVSSPVRAFGAVGGRPLFVASAAGARFTDADGREFLDFVQSWGPLVLGHAHPRVVGAVQRAAAAGTSFGAPCEAELELAEHLCRSYPGLERVRFTSSGTEATMSALRLARGATGRDRIVKFAGCYHGHGDALLVAAGSGAATFGHPSSAGVPGALAALTTVLPLDDEDAFTAFMDEHGDEVAAVIVEPVPANNGLLVQRPEFLRTLRRATADKGALLIFDEVISGFRLGPAGAAGHYDVTPDLATFGKVVGGGLPVGAIGGRADLLAHLAPEGPVYQAGTLSGNPVAMAAGLETLRVLEEEQGWSVLEQRGARLAGRMAEVVNRSDQPLSWVHLGSLFWLSFTGEPPRRADVLPDDAAPRYARLFATCLERGVYLAPSAFEVGFLATAHTDADLDHLAAVLEEGIAAADGGAP